MWVIENPGLNEYVLFCKALHMLLLFFILESALLASATYHLARYNQAAPVIAATSPRLLTQINKIVKI